MSKKSRRTRRMRNMLLVVSMMMVVAMASVGVTVAWLTAETDSIVNTFTTSGIEITLDETTGTTYKMVPGTTMAKDPKVTVLAGSEACYVFVKIEKSDAYDTYMEDYVVAEGWTKLTNTDATENGVEEVYYTTQADLSAEGAQPAVHYVLAGGTNGTVTVKDDVTAEQMKLLKVEGATQPTLTFTAYACQSANVANAATAWNNINAQ